MDLLLIKARRKEKINIRRIDRKMPFTNMAVIMSFFLARQLGFTCYFPVTNQFEMGMGVLIVRYEFDQGRWGGEGGGIDGWERIEI